MSTFKQHLVILVTTTTALAPTSTLLHPLPLHELQQRSNSLSHSPSLPHHHHTPHMPTVHMVSGHHCCNCSSTASPHHPLPQLQLQLQPSSSFSSNDTHLQPRTSSQSCHSLYIPTSLPAVLILSFFHAFASLVGNVGDMSANVSDVECLRSLARQRTSKVGATCDVTNVTT